MKAIESRPHVVAERVVELLEDAGVDPAEGRVLVVGASYKPGVRDTRESPAVRIMRSLWGEGVAVAYHDPLVRSLEAGDGLAILSAAHPRAGDYDLAVLVTMHDGHDYGWLGEFEHVLDCTYRTPLGAQRVTDLVAATATTGRLPTRAPTPWINHALRLICAIYLALIVVAVIAYKSVFIEVVVADPFFGVYSVVVCVFILSRFAFSLFYHPAPDPEQPLEPTVAVVMPAFNEEEAVANSIRSLLAVDYPREKLEIVVVNDGSTDGTLREIYSVADCNRAVRVIGFRENRGKRAAMAAGIRATRAEVVALRRLRQLARARRLAQDRAGLRRPARRRDRGSRRGAERARDPDHADAGGALLRRLPRLQGGGVDLRRGHVLLGLLLRVPA